MSQPSSDAAFELVGACIHSLRFAFGGPLDYPHAPAVLAEDNPPPALFRRLQAVSPPPSREGDAWHTGITLDGKPFHPSVMSERLAEVQYDEGIPSLDAPDPDTIVLDQTFRVPRERTTMHFPGPDHGKWLLSIGYWSPIPSGGVSAEKDVDYYGTYRMTWAKPPVGAWVAVTFDAFWPPERDSADILIPIGDCDGECPN